jgi:hypothetical protein
MKFIEKFNQRHYGVYLEKIDKYIGKHKSINTWIKSLDDFDLIIWLNLIRIIENNNDEYYEEYSILLTIVINFFILELDIDQNIKLKNSFILKLFKNFKYSLYREYSNRNHIMDYNEEEYVLI